MLFMSWAGESTVIDSDPSLEYYVHPEAIRIRDKLRALGVEHNDLRPPNVMQNPQTKARMLIDFDCSKINEEGPKEEEPVLGSLSCSQNENIRPSPRKRSPSKPTGTVARI